MESILRGDKGGTSGLVHVVLYVIFRKFYNYVVVFEKGKNEKVGKEKKKKSGKDSPSSIPSF